jgi:hypothetical protein
VAAATVEAARDEAVRQGITPSQLGEKARETLSKAQQTAQEKLKEESTPGGEENVAARC